MRMKTKKILSLLAGGALALSAGGSLQAADWDDERSARAFETLDIDNSGGLTIDELRVGLKNSSDADKAFKRLDTNLSGRISARELEQGYDVANNYLRTDIYKVDSISQARVMESTFQNLDTD